MKKSEKTKKEMISFMTSPETDRELDLIVSLWGESRSACIRRAISLASRDLASGLKLDKKKAK